MIGGTRVIRQGALAGRAYWFVNERREPPADAP
jgi:hypothetical protein